MRAMERLQLHSIQSKATDGRWWTLNSSHWLAVVLLCLGCLSAGRVQAQSTARIAVAVSVTGAGQTFGAPAVEGATLAVEEANATRLEPRIEIQVFDDQSIAKQGLQNLDQIAAGEALVVVGPATTPMALAVGSACTRLGITCIGTTSTADTVTQEPNMFRGSFSTGDVGEALANYLRYILNGSRAMVLVNDDGYGHFVADGFKRAAERLGIATVFTPYKTPAEGEAAARRAAAQDARTAIVLATLDAESLLKSLRRAGVKGPILGTNTIAGEFFSDRFAREPEEQQRKGFFTNGVYAASPVMFDSANSDTLDFADRFRRRFGHDPSYVTVQGYESMRLAIAAVRGTAGGASDSVVDIRSRRSAIRSFLLTLDGPTRAVPGLGGPMWFSAERGRVQPLRIGRFQAGRFESAPAQLVPVSTANGGDIASNALFDIGGGRFARRQQVAYAGVYVNEIPRLDISQSRFTADFYVWLRYLQRSGADDADPAQLEFPDMIRGSSDGKVLAAERHLGDGTTYRLWRVRGDFKNDFDLHRYPADRQTLAIRFINGRAATDQVVYVVDRGTSLTQTAAWEGEGVIALSEPSAENGQPVARDGFNGLAEARAFRDLTQWQPMRINQGRNSVVTRSALGDPGLVALNPVRELSGFRVTIDLRRLVFATLIKTLLPLGLMALILLASLFFPTALVKEKVTVAITGALSGAVLLSSINSQLGNVSYVMTIEYVFYLFFTLCLLCILIVLTGERLRVSKRNELAMTIENTGRYVFIAGLVGVALILWIASIRT